MKRVFRYDKDQRRMVEVTPRHGGLAQVSGLSPSTQEHIEVHSKNIPRWHPDAPAERDANGHPVFTSRKQLREFVAKNPEYAWSGDRDPTGIAQEHVEAVKAQKAASERAARALQRGARFHGGDPLHSRGRSAMAEPRYVRRR